MPINNKSTIDANILANLPDNQDREISAEDTRDILRDINDSAPFQDITSSGDNAGTIVIDLNKPVQTITLTGVVTGMSTINKSTTVSKLCKVYLTPGASDKLISFNSAWKWAGVKPSGLFANVPGLLLLVNFGSGESNMVAAYEHLGIGVTGVYL